MDVLTLDLNRSTSVPGASREPAEPDRSWRSRPILVLLRRIASGGSGGAFATRRNGLLGFTAATIVLGVGLLAVTSLISAPWASIDPGIGADTTLAGPTGGLLLWLLYGLIGSLRILRMPGGGTMTFHLPFVGAAMILGGPTAGAWVGFLATIERRELETQPWYGILANHAVLVISAVAGGVTTRVVAMAMGPDAGGAGLLVPAAAGAIVLAVLSTALAAVTVLLREDLTIRELADIMVHKVGRVTAIECALVVVLALAYLQIGWWAPVLVAIFVLVVWDNDPMAPPDPLTGLPLRTSFERQLDAGVGRLRRGMTAGATVLHIDLDFFKKINDNVSYEAGDEVLAEVGRRLRAHARRADDLAGRIGGDEFAMFLPGLGDPEVSLRRADEIVASLCLPIATGAGAMTIGASIGVVVEQAWGGVPSAATLLAQAGSAMKAAKAAGGGSHLYDPTEPQVKLGNRRP
jgi:diguanylate cyclase (GGDEF)-like protein